MKIMKKHILAIFVAALSLASSCHKPEYVLSTADRQGFTSISAYFTSGQYDGSVLARLDVTQEMLESGILCIPVPYYYPEESDDSSTPMMAMSKVRIRAELDNNCSIDPPLSILDLNEMTKIRYTDSKGKVYNLELYGKMKKSDKASIMGMSITGPNCGTFDAFVDNENRILYLYTTDDLSDCTISVDVSAHSSVKTDGTVARNYNESQDVVIASHSGKEYTYKTQKAIPTKIAHGFNKTSVRQLFNFEPASRLGTPAYTAATNPSIASIGGYLVVCMGDGSTPIYLDGQTGAKKGEIVLGSAQPGSIASDEAGNMLICNHIADDPYSGTLSIYKTSSVSEAPVLFYEYDSQTILPRGGKMEVNGNLNSDAMITILFEGIAGITTSSSFISIQVKDGAVVSAQEYDLAGLGLSWGHAPVNAGVVTPASGNGDMGWYFGAYSGMSGGPELDWIKKDLSLGSNMPTSNGSGWAWNANQIDCKSYNNAQYLALLVLSHFPAWGVAPTLYVYDVTDTSGLKDEFDSCDALVMQTEIEWFQQTNADDTNSCGDVVIVPSADGYKVFIYYFDQYAGAIGGFVADCIKRD